MCKDDADYVKECTNTTMLVVKGKAPVSSRGSC